MNGHRAKAIRKYCGGVEKMKGLPPQVATAFYRFCKRIWTRKGVLGVYNDSVSVNK